MKQCIRCGQSRPESEFYKHPQMSSGRLNKCMDCCKEQAREYGQAWRAGRTDAQRAEKMRRDRNWERIKKRDKRFTPAEWEAIRLLRLAAQRRKQDAWRAAHPERMAELGRRAAMRRYARKKGAAGDATADQIAARWEMWGASAGCAVTTPRRQTT